MSFRSLKQCLPYILPTLVSRLGVKEIAESSEELRLELVEYLHDLIKSANETSQAAQSSIGDATGLGEEMQTFVCYYIVYRLEQGESV